ncbi:MAG: glycosyltransferase family 2 protein [Anaerolineae bacterium]|nr:glycosyltransferase family 2 protein [Anaerolineae bacterium]
MAQTLIAIILTYNEAQHITACIESLRWMDSIVVFDSVSSDETVRLAQAAGATVLQHPFENYSKQRQLALESVTSEWVFFVDADERSSPEQATEIRRKIENPEIHAYGVPRHNYICGKLTKGAGWFPDYQVRLLRRSKVHYDLSREVHELVIVDGQSSVLETPLTHYNYQTWNQFFRKQERYTDYEARELLAQGVRVKPQNYVLQPLRAFYRRFITLDGYLDGFHGLRLSAIMAYYELQKYLRLNRLWQASR